MPNPNNLVISKPTAEDVSIFGEILTESLRFPPNDRQDWKQRIGIQNARIVKQDGKLAGGGILVDMGQYWGGRAVTMTGIHGVAVAPEFRGEGVASSLMKALVRELHQRQVGLSVLYPATQTVYRNSGYELAGLRTKYEGNASSLASAERTLKVRRYEPGLREAVEAIYMAGTRHQPGHLERIDWNWNRLINPRQGPGYGYVVFDDFTPVGYMFFRQIEESGNYFHIEILDLAALTTAGVKRLMTILADHRSMISGFSWYGADNDLMAISLREQWVSVSWRMAWMLRITHLVRALEDRGYPQPVSARLEIQVDDPDIPGQAGNWQLEVRDGRAALRKGGKGDLKCHVRGLAGLYSGFFSAEKLAQVGLVEGTDQAMTTATAIFGGPTPWMTDMF